MRNSLRNYMRSKVSNPAVAEDLLQDVFVKALAAIGADRAPRHLAGWLYTVARTTVIDYYRASRPETAELDDDLPDTRHADDEHLHQELAACMRPLTQQLPGIYRDTLLAADFDGRSLRSIADEQGVSLSAIKSRASRARVMLREKLLDCCHVEVSGGIVSDYHRHHSGSRGGCT
jgi:RNA polymerase sigma-70 factor (ECF subfamily)